MRVIVTRPRAQAGPLVAALESLGAEVVECPLIVIERTSDEPIDCCRLRLADRHEPERRRRDRAPAGATCRRRRRRPGDGRGAAVARDRARVRARESSQDGLLREFPRPAGRVLFAAAEGARRGPIDALGADFVPLYRTRLLQPEPPEGDVVVLASGSAARAYARIGGTAPAVTIGPETTRVARAAGLEVRGRGGDARPRMGSSRPCSI